MCGSDPAKRNPKLSVYHSLMPSAPATASNTIASARSRSVPRLAWRLGASVREYRELVEGEAWPSAGVWERIEEFSGWPRVFRVAQVERGRLRWRQWWRGSLGSS
jgi:hypothetical protein